MKNVIKLQVPIGQSKQKLKLTKELLKRLPLGFVFTAEVTTPSMSPLLPVGCFVKVKRIRIVQVSEGDIIMFVNTNYSYPAVHRVTKKVKRNSKVLLFTKGDNTPQADAYPAEQTNFIGIVIQKLNSQGGYEDLVMPRVYSWRNWLKHLFTFYK